MQPNKPVPMKKNPVLQMFADDFKKRKQLGKEIWRAEDAKRKLEQALHENIVNELLAYDMSDIERHFLNHKVRGVRIIETLVQHAMSDTYRQHNVIIDKRVQHFLFSKLNQNSIKPIIDSLNKTFASVLKFHLYERRLDAEFIKLKPSKE
jgi:hypothetical protein